MTPSALRRDQYAAWLAFGAFVVYFAWLFSTHPFWAERTRLQDFGMAAEYGNIAKALLEGKGFANPFRGDSGPTAWMPPLLVLYISSIYGLFGVGTAATIWAAMLSQYAALALTTYLLIRTAGQTPFARFRYLPGLLFVAFVFAMRHENFFEFHDHGLMQLLVVALIYAWQRDHQRQRAGLARRPALLWVLAAVLPLAAPVIGLAFLACLGVSHLVHTQGWQKLPPGYGHRLRTDAALVILFAASLSIWTIRNYRAFGTFIPTKSNFWYDFHQANVLSDGIIRMETLLRYHPYLNPKAYERYAQRGEIGFMETYRTESKTYLQTRPSDYVRTVRRRAGFVFVLAKGHLGTAQANLDAFSARDRQVLDDAEIIFGDLWMRMDTPADTIAAQMAALPLENHAAAFADWQRGQDELLAPRGGLKYYVTHLFVSLVPTVCIALGLLLGPVRRQPGFWLTVVAYLTYLTPYLLATIYRRYMMAALPLQLLIEFFVVGYLLHTFLPKRPGHVSSPRAPSSEKPSTAARIS